MISTRIATAADLPAVVALLADDDLGQTRNPAYTRAEEAYLSAFAELQADNNCIVVATLARPADTLADGPGDGRGIIGTYQLTFIRGLAFAGGLRAQVESVRIAHALRGQGLGTALMHDALARAAQRGAFMVQLTTDIRRSQTRTFYERLGFSATHHGMKVRLPR